MDVATPTKDYLELIRELLVSVMKERSDRNANFSKLAKIPELKLMQTYDFFLFQKSLLLGYETEIEGILATVLKNYKSLDESYCTGLADMSAPTPETAAPVLAPNL
ncbi:hypothetical protein HAX54_005461 [Datura stramonium]|uniref:Uncharacterized protein n=1 Tax=Datura stramonium TaxID=4076 RepID=A0ABS8T8T4_DATST|nr:hypothetical protein [Datura stramonium]